MGGSIRIRVDGREYYEQGLKVSVSRLTGKLCKIGSKILPWQEVDARRYRKL